MMHIVEEDKSDQLIDEILNLNKTYQPEEQLLPVDKNPAY